MYNIKQYAEEIRLWYTRLTRTEQDYIDTIVVVSVVLTGLVLVFLGFLAL